MERQELRGIVRGYYDLQKLRIQNGNRIIGNWKVKMGQAPGEREEELSKNDLKVLEIIRASYRT